MRYRLLGRTGLRVSEVFLGAMRFGEEDQARAIVDVYDEAGGNVIDTADMYGAGRSEELVGAALKGRRDRFVLATKYTCTRDAADLNAGGNHRKNLARALDASLRRLGTDHIDLYWAHIWDRRTPIEEMMRALDDAVRAGKILYVGMSDAPAWVVARANTLAEWRDWTPFAALQLPYNPLERDIERELLPMAEHLGLSVATWSPLAHGVLTGKGKAPLDERQAAVVRVLEEIGGELGAPPAHVAIAWSRARSRAVLPILGSSRPEQIAENLGALDLALPAEAVERLNAATDFELGFPADFINSADSAFGTAIDRLDDR
ncbi:aldo/keto reductase [Spirillospora sp. NPDC050679]